MIDYASWFVAHEVIASIPFTFGYHPQESIVLTTCRVDPGTLRIGASARLDLEAVDGPNAGMALAHILDALSRTDDEAAIVTVFTDREVGVWVFDLVDALDDDWPFPEHGGCYVVSGQRIHGFTRGGEPTGVCDELELLTTRVAMAQPACSFVERPEGFRFTRTRRGATVDRVAGALRDLARGGPPSAAETGDLTRTLVQEVARGGPTQPDVRARLLHALESVPFRDGFMAWALGGGGDDVEDFTHLDPAPALVQPRPPDHAVLAAVYETLGRLARFAPAGRARAPLGVAAYLAWYAGDGTRARMLCLQALEEDRTYSLATLVRDALEAACPPPWFRTDAA